MNPPVGHPKYQAIMKSARDLFWKYGLRKVNVEDICRVASVSKMTFYRYFPNKVELAKKVFDVVAEEGTSEFFRILNEDLPVAEKISLMIRMKLEGVSDISGEFLMDLYANTDSGLKEHVEQVTAASWEKVLDYFRQAQQKGVFRKDIKPEFLLFFSQKISEMVTDEHLLKLYGTPHELLQELTHLFVYGIAERSITS